MIHHLLHSIHEWQQVAQVWLATRNPDTVDAAMLLAMTLEGMGVPGIPGEIPMLAQAGLIEAGERTYLHAAVIGTIANFLGSLLGYVVGQHSVRWLPQRWHSRVVEGAGKLSASPHSGWLILLSRSFGALRTPITWGAGAGNYPFVPYAIWAFWGAVLHVFVWQYALWKGTGWLGHLRPHELLTVACVAVIAALLWWLWQINRRRQQAAQLSAPQKVETPNH